jgi:hypothetical protein
MWISEFACGFIACLLLEFIVAMLLVIRHELKKPKEDKNKEG